MADISESWISTGPYTIDRYAEEVAMLREWGGVCR